MPNWCHNPLAVRGPAQELQRFKDKAPGYSPWLKPEEIGANEPDPLNFHSLCPVPEELVKAGYTEGAYRWELEHWGCKWGAGATEVVEDYAGCIIYEFDTAWSPPVPLVENLSRQWPQFSFILGYEEPGNGFQGLARAKNGKLDHLRVEY